MISLFRPHPLPLRWFRIPLLILTIGLAVVCIAVAAQAINRSMMLEDQLSMAAANSGLTGYDFDMQDVRSVTGVLLTVACLLTAVSISSFLVLSWDWLALLVNPSSIAGKRSLSTRTLKLQAGVMAFICVWLLAVLIPSTVIVRTHHARVMVNGMNFPVLPPNLSAVDTMYWDYGFLRCLGAAPWFCFIAALPTTLVTWCASRLEQRVPVQDSKVSEKA